MIAYIKNWIFPIIWIFLTFFLFSIVLLTSNEINMWPPLLSADGLSLFVKVFAIPLYFFAAGIPIYGIILTVKRMKQSEKQFSLLMYSSYYKHLEDFITFLKNSNSNDVHIISHESNENYELLYRKWHEIWFGNEKEFNHNAKKSTISDAMNFLSTVSDVRRIVLHDEIVNDNLLSTIKEQLAKLGIIFSDDIIHSVQHKGTVGQFQSSVKIIVTLLKLSGERFQLDEYIRLLVE